MSKTIYDVAREAGVGVATVSRALNGSGYVSEATLKKIERACVGYSRFPARKSQIQKMRAIGLIVSHDPEYFFVNSTYMNTMIGISAVARERDFRFMLEIESKSEMCMNLFKSGMIDGAILMGIKQDNTLISELLEEKYPFVLIGDYLEESSPFCKIDIDDFAMAKEAVQHLIALGHKHIGFIGGSLEYASCRKRVAGYRAALEEAKLKADERDCVFCSNINQEKVSNLAKKLLYQPNRVTALLTFNDSVAFSVYKVAKEMGIRIPEGLSVVSFDDSDIAKSLSPGLTTVQQPSYEKGYQAAYRLLKQIENPTVPVDSVSLEAVMIYRESCSAPPTI